MRTKYGTQILRTPPDVLIGFLKAWDEIAKEESAKNPYFKKVLDSQREYAAKVVPPSASCSRRIPSRPTTTGPRRQPPR